MKTNELFNAFDLYQRKFCGGNNIIVSFVSKTKLNLIMHYTFLVPNREIPSLGIQGVSLTPKSE